MSLKVPFTQVGLMTLFPLCPFLFAFLKVWSPNLVYYSDETRVWFWIHFFVYTIGCETKRLSSLQTFPSSFEHQAPLSPRQWTGFTRPTGPT